MENKYEGIKIHFLDFDIYSKPIGFFYRDKERIGTLFGFVLTIIYLIICLALFAFYTLTTINKSDMKVHDSFLYQKDAPEMKINSSFFYFAFGVENYLTGYTRFIDETIYYPRVEYVHKVKDGSIFKTIEKKVLHFERCKSENFGKDYEDLLVNGELNNSYCINDLNLTLSGNFKFEKLSYIQINIHPCVNNTENNYHCKPREVIDEYLSGTFISILAKDIGLEPSNYTHPVVPQFQDIYSTIDKSYFRDFVVFYGITEIQTDKGLFYEQIHKDRYINLMKTTEGLYYQELNNYYKGESMCEVQIRMSDDIRIQKRTYRKMSEVFAITGGYMQLISTIFSIITFLSNKIDHEVKLVNSIFNFYPNKKKITLKHKLQKFPIGNDFHNNMDYSFSKVRNESISMSNKRNSILNAHKNNVFQIYSNDISSPSIGIVRKRENMHNGKLSENSSKEKDIPNYMKAKNEKSSSNNESNKSKIAFLTMGMNSKSLYKKKTIFNKSLIIKKKESIVENKNKKMKDWKKSLEFTPIDYYCLSKFKNKEEIKLFNLAIAFYKQKLDVIYLFHIILLFEKVLGSNITNIINDEDLVFHLNE